MDPNETLEQLRAAVDILDQRQVESFTEATIIEYFRALDEWLSKGGFLPKDWHWTTDDRTAHTIDDMRH